MTDKFTILLLGGSEAVMAFLLLLWMGLMTQFVTLQNNTSE